MHTHDVVALTTLTSIFRVAVEKNYEQDNSFHQKLSENTPAEQLQELIELEARLDPTYSDPDYSRDYYVAVLAFNEKFARAFANIAGDDELKRHIPEGQGNQAMAQDLASFGCPTLARLFAPARAAKPS
jgi:heme oxygenase